MNVAEVIEVLLSAGAARATAPAGGLPRVVTVAGIEMVACPATDEAGLRRSWRERYGSGPTPGLVICDQPGGQGLVLALGPERGDGPIRSAQPEALAEALSRVATLPRLDAVRELAAELDRMDETGIPGMKVSGLLTLHTLTHRLRGDATRWAGAVAVTSSLARDDWRTVLTGLGYQLDRRPHRGYLARHEGRPVLVVHPKRDPAELGRLDLEGRPPEGLLLNDCRSDGAPFGLLAAGGRMRLYALSPDSGSAVSSFIELDAPRLQLENAPFLGLLGPAYLAEGGFERLVSEARAYGAGLRARVDQTIRQRVLPRLATSLGRWAIEQGRDLEDDAVRQELERATLTLVFRLLFLLYAESAGHLPMGNVNYRNHSLTAMVGEAADTAPVLSPRSTSLWDRFRLLVEAMRHANPAWQVPAYNGALFAADGFNGAATVEALRLSDPDFGAVLVAVGREGDHGVDYSTLDIGHLGHIYEGLLSLRLVRADAPLRYDLRSDSYVEVRAREEIEVEPGGLLWQTNEGGRKSGGVYYTPTALVRHLVAGAVLPAYEEHLRRVEDLASRDPAAAAEALFDFKVLDPACGSAHFLVEVLNTLGDCAASFLARTPLPGVARLIEHLRAGAGVGPAIDDVALLRRLVLKRSVFGVDISPMGAEIAKLSMWLASFVPGLSLAYLDRNVVVGNSLIGVARQEGLHSASGSTASWLDDRVDAALAVAAVASSRLAALDDRTPDEVALSAVADAEARAATEGLTRLFNLWTAEPFGLQRAREDVNLHGPEVLAGTRTGLVSDASRLADEHDFLHWPLAFPATFGRERPGFDAVVGNPPWEEVTVEELAFYARFRPGLRSLAERQRARAITDLVHRRPELADRLAEAQERVSAGRSYYPTGEYTPMAGDPDLYKFFCQRYRTLVREGGRLGVVLPRSAFLAQGSIGFRRWLFEELTCQRIDFLLNRRCWMFKTHPQYTIALVTAEKAAPGASHRVSIAGVADSMEMWEVQASSPGVAIGKEAFGADWVVPLVRSDEEVGLLARLRKGSRFPFGSGRRWICFPVRELDETNDKHLWQRARTGRPLWKGESFDQYDPHGSEARVCPASAAVVKKVRKPRPGADSLVAETVPLARRKSAVLGELERARVAFRDITNRTNSRTVLACLIPPAIFLTNKAPYLAFVEGGPKDQAACLAILNSLPFDWQARRFVETNVNFFILEGLVVPDLDDETTDAVAKAAARLSSVDDRFADFAAACGVGHGPLESGERDRLRVEIDARVAHAWGLSDEDLDLLLSDFTVDAVPAAYREALQVRLEELR